MGGVQLAADSFDFIAATLKRGEGRLLVLHANIESYRDLIELHIDGDQVQICRRYGNLPSMLSEFRPDMLLSFKLNGDPDPYPSAAITGSDTLRWVHVGGAGVDHLGVWDPARLTVTNSSGIHCDLMAQYSVAAMVMFTQHFRLYAHQQREHEWRRVDCLNLRGRTVVVVGFGSIGEAVGEAARGFGMRVVGIRTTPRHSNVADEVWPVSRLADAAGEADFFIVCLPLTEHTRGLIGREVIGVLKPGAVVINISRGGIIDERALLEALDADALSGAVMDVFATEPIPNTSPFWDHPKVIVTPHSSSDFAGWERAVAEIFSQNIGHLMAERPMINVVDPLRGY